MKQIIINNPIFSGFLKYSFSSWINLFLGIISVVLSTRLLLPETYAVIILFLSAANVLLYVMTFGMDNAYIRFFNTPPEKNTSSQILYKNILLITAVLFAIAVPCILLCGKRLSSLLFSCDSPSILILLILYTYSLVVFRYINLYYRMSFKATRYNIQNVLFNSLSKVVVIVAACFSQDSFPIIFSIVVASLTLLLFYLFFEIKSLIPYNEHRRIDFSLSFKGYNSFFKYSLFSAPTYVMNYSNTFISQKIIDISLSPNALGIYSSPGFISSIINTARTGFSNFWAAYVFKNYEEEHTNITRFHDYLLFLSIIFLSGLIIFRDFLYLFIGKNYHQSKEFFSLLLAFPILNLIRETTDKGIALAKKNYISMFAHMFFVLSNILLCFLLIPVFGLLGAACSNLIASLFLFAIDTYYGQKYYKSICNPFKTFLGILIVVIILFLPVVFPSYFIVFVLLLDLIAAMHYHEIVASIISKTIHILQDKNI